MDERNDNDEPDQIQNQSRTEDAIEQAVRAIGFYEAQRKEVLMALENLRRALNARRPKPPTP